MKVSICEKCKYYRRKTWNTYYKPSNYHAIGVSHAYAYSLREVKNQAPTYSCIHTTSKRKGGTFAQERPRGFL